MTQKQLAEASGLAAKRVKMIVALLETIGILERKRRLKQLREFATDQELCAFLEEYEYRHQDDRERLEAMMIYGQTTQCRARYLSDYFQEKIDADCGYCDNCRDRTVEPSIN